MYNPCQSFHVADFLSGKLGRRNPRSTTERYAKTYQEWSPKDKGVNQETKARVNSMREALDNDLMSRILGYGK